MTDRNQARQRAYIEGRNAYRDGLSKDSCTYEDIVLRAEWERGFEDAFNDHAESFGA